MLGRVRGSASMRRACASISAGVASRFASAAAKSSSSGMVPQTRYERREACSQGVGFAWPGAPEGHEALDLVGGKRPPERALAELRDEGPRARLAVELGAAGEDVVDLAGVAIGEGLGRAQVALGEELGDPEDARVVVETVGLFLGRERVGG